MKDLAVVPVKNLAEAKRRLSNSLSPNERRMLVLAMLEDVLHAITRSGVFAGTLVVSPDESIAKLVALNHGVFVRQKGAGLNAAIRQAIRHAFHDDVSCMTTILADLPLVEAKDFQELAHITREKPKVVLVPSSKGGTNVMARSPPNIIPNSYGRWSFAKHLRTAQRKGVSAYSVSNFRLSLDIDTIQDLRYLRQLDPSGKTHSGRLAKVIAAASQIARKV